MISVGPYGETPEGIPVQEYMIRNDSGAEMRVIDYGCTITSIKVPDRDGSLEDVVLGFDSLNGYLTSIHYVGCLIGRFANRIAKGQFELDGQGFTLEKNLGHHHLHGGMKGFDKVVWQSKKFENENGEGVELKHISPDGYEGYPGNLDVTVRYLLTQNNEIILEYLATTDKKTIINLTQHTYFNLNGGHKDVLQHELCIDADRMLTVDETMIPTGELKDVAGTPLNFVLPKSIGRDIHSRYDQLQYAHGYDHYWVLNKTANELRQAATLYDPESGRVLEVFTTEPGLQLYTGNFLDDHVPGKNGATYGPYAGLCLETQHFPDSPHHPEFPSVVLNVGDEFKSRTVWKFSVREK